MICIEKIMKLKRGAILVNQKTKRKYLFMFFSPKKRTMYIEIPGIRISYYGSTIHVMQNFNLLERTPTRQDKSNQLQLF